MNNEALSSFLKIAEMRSLSAAAKRYGLPKSTLSLRVKQLEGELGVNLFTRSGHSLLLTDAGLTLTKHARRILGECDAARVAVAEAGSEVSGTLRIGATGEFGTAFYAQMLIAFRKTHPNVELELSFFPPHMLHVTENLEAYDAVISWAHGDIEQDGETLSTASFALFASPTYVAQYGLPSSPADLANHEGILFRTPSGLQTWRLQRANEQSSTLPRSRLIANDYWTLKYFAVAGEGIAYLPRFFADLECEHGDLVRLLDDWESVERHVVIRVMRPHAPSRKLTAFMDICRSYFSPGFTFTGPRYYVERILSPNRQDKENPS